MVYLNPPFYVINGVALLPDSQDRLQWYYLPLAPHFTLTQNANGASIPSLLLAIYTGSAGNGGFLECDVNIGIDENALADLQRALRSQANLPDMPRIVPVTLSDGFVNLILLDKQSQPPATTPPGARPAATPATDADGLQFVTRFLCPAKPSLYGDNQAALSAELSQWGATALAQTLQGDITPIAVVYSMEFLALRPAYAVKCNVHWDRVQKHLDEQFSASTLFASSEIDKVVDQLIENRDIELDVDTFVPEGEDTAGVIADRDRAVNEVREMITNAFFTSSLDPINSAKDGWDRAAAFGERISQLAVTGGLASIAHFSYNKLDYTRIDQKNLVVNMSERTVVNRSLYPQGHLSGLTKILQQSGVDLNQFIIHVKLDDPFFQRRKIAVYFPRSFDAEAISTIEVNLNYGGDIKSVVLSPANPSGTVDWASQLVDNAMKREVSATYKVNFNSADSSQRPLFLNSGTEVVTSDVYSIETSQLYEVVRVPVHALPPFPWDHYANVDVQLQYNDAANGIALLGHFMLNQDHPEVVWEKFQRPPFLSKFQYKLIYYAADNQAIEQPWVDNDGDEVRIVDPFPSKRTVLIVPDFLWTVVDRVFVDVSYTDPGNAVAVQQHYEFNANSAATQHFTTDLRNPNVRRVEYETTIIMKDTRVVRVPRSATLDTEIIVNTDMRGHLIVQVKPDNVDFASVQLQQVSAQIKYQDPANNLAFKDSFRFSSSADQGVFNYDYIDPQNSRYQSSLTYQYTNGFIKTVDWLPGDGDLLIPINPM